MSNAAQRNKITDHSLAYGELVIVPKLEETERVPTVADLWTEYEAPHKRWQLSASAVLALLNTEL